jgi:hypothetical protein
LGAAVASLAAAGAVSRVASAAAPAAAAVSLDVAAVGAPTSCAVAEALISAARIRAKAVLAKMRSKRGPLIRTLSQSSRGPALPAGPHVQIHLRHLGAKSGVDSPIEATAE